MVDFFFFFWTLVVSICVCGGGAFSVAIFFSVLNTCLLLLFTEVTLIKTTCQVMGLSNGFADMDLKGDWFCGMDWINTFHSSLSPTF